MFKTGRKIVVVYGKYINYLAWTSSEMTKWQNDIGNGFVFCFKQITQNGTPFDLIDFFLQ